MSEEEQLLQLIRAFGMLPEALGVAVWWVWALQVRVIFVGRGSKGLGAF